VEDFDRAVRETDALKFDDARHEPSVMPSAPAG
jgi:hypothetical protein